MRSIDHLVVAVHDLEAAAAFYDRLGFQVGARNRHPWGTENRLIQFPHAFIELIAIGEAADIPPPRPGMFSFGAFIRDYLAHRAGIAMLVLDSADAKADAAAFAAAGIGAFEPFFFARQGRRPDGSTVEVAFTLAFAAEANSEAGFFVCQQHRPENFWNPAFQRHPNGAAEISAVGLSAGQPAAHARFLACFSGAAAEADMDGGLAFGLTGGRMTVLPSRDPAAPLRLTTLTFALPDIPGLIRRLAAANIAHTAEDGVVQIQSDAAFGATLVFRAPRG